MSITTFWPSASGYYNYAGEHNGAAYYAGDAIFFGDVSYLYRADNGNWQISGEKFSVNGNFWSSKSDCPYDSATWYMRDNTWAIEAFHIKATPGKIGYKYSLNISDNKYTIDFRYISAEFIIYHFL